MESPVMLRVVKLGKEMIEKEIWTQQIWRLLNSTARNYERFSCNPKQSLMYLLQRMHRAGITCPPAKTFFSRQQWLAAVGDWLGGCWTSGLAQDVCLTTSAFAILQRKTVFPALTEWPLYLFCKVLPESTAKPHTKALPFAV